MLRALPLLIGLVPSSALAGLSDATVGAWVDAGAGLGAADRPFRAGVGWTAAVGGFWGRYDEALAVGRHVGVGARVRQDLELSGDAPDALRTAALVDAHRGIDLLALSVRFGGVAGPVLVQRLDGGSRLDVGGTVRAAGSVGWRFLPRASLQLRAEAGIDVQPHDDAELLVTHLVVAPSVGVTLGIEALLPARSTK